MAASALTATINAGDTDVSKRYITYYGTIAWAAGDYSAGGNTVSFGGVSGLQSSTNPIEVHVWSETGSGWMYQWIKDATTPTLANGKLAVYSGGTGGSVAMSQVTAGAAPASLVADVIKFSLKVRTAGVKA